MKIGMLSEFYYPQPGGVSEHIRSVSRELELLGHDVVVLTSNIRGGVPERGPRVRRLGWSMPIRYNGSLSRFSVGWRLEAELRRVLAEEELDILHIHNPLMPTLPLLGLRNASCPIVATFHSYYQRDLLVEAFRLPLRRLLSRVVARVPVSISARRAVAGLFPGEYHIVPNGVDYDFFAQAAARRVRMKRSGRRHILFVGALVWRKGLPTLLKSFTRIADQRTDVDLIVVGDGPGSGRIKRQLPRRLRDRVHFLGCLPRKKLLECFTVSDVFCAPSLGRESFGMVLLEAMAAGLPVVASDIEGYRNVVTHDQDGYLIAPGRPDRWSRALLDLLDEPETINRLGRNGQRKALTYRWAAIAGKLESIYYGILEPERGADLEEEALLAAGRVVDAHSPVFQDG